MSLTREQIELLPCPFCGSSDLLFLKGGPTLHDAVKCVPCNLYVPLTAYEWNTRAPLKTASQSDEQPAVAPADEQSAGGVVVPREPTDTMLFRGGFIDRNEHQTTRLTVGVILAQRVYKAMIAAAPPSSSPEVGKDAERYRYLRDKKELRRFNALATEQGHLSVCQSFGTWGQHLYGDELDAAIDTALSAERKDRP